MDRMTERALLAASRGEGIKTVSDLGDEDRENETRSSRMRTLALALVDARNSGRELKNAEEIKPVIEAVGITQKEYYDLVGDPDWWSVLGAAAVETTPGQYLATFMTMAEKAAEGDTAARTAYFKQMEGITNRGVGQEERYLASLDSKAIKREAEQVTKALGERLEEMDIITDKRRAKGEESVQGSLSEVLQARDRLGTISEDALGLGK